MALHWKRRLAEWRAVVRDYGRGHYASMVLAILSGPVPARVWRSRLHKCMRCPILNRERMICRHELPNGGVLGCSCSVTMLALSAAPYERGCWARMVDTSGKEGWPSYHFPNVRAKLRAVWRFLFP